MVFGYIDPSSMTYLIQIIAGVVIAAGAGLGFYWKRIRRAMKNKKEAREAAAAGTELPAEQTGAAEGETFTADMLKSSENDDTPKQ